MYADNHHVTVVDLESRRGFGEFIFGIRQLIIHSVDYYHYVWDTDQMTY